MTTQNEDDDLGVRMARHLAKPESTPQRLEMRRLAEATRRVIDRLVATRAPQDELARAADALEEIASGLERFPQGRVFEGFAESANAGDPRAFFDHSPVIGKANPIAPPMDLDVVDGVVQGRVRFGAAYEGPPGHVHGGYIACVFDELLGMTQSLSGNPGMTGTLTVRYRRPTPLHTDLRLEGVLDRVDGRKIFTTGRMFAGDVLTAESDGIFISINIARFDEMMKLRDS